MISEANTSNKKVCKPVLKSHKWMCGWFREFWHQVGFWIRICDAESCRSLFSSLSSLSPAILLSTSKPPYPQYSPILPSCCPFLCNNWLSPYNAKSHHWNHGPMAKATSISGMCQGCDLLLYLSLFLSAYMMTKVSVRHDHHQGWFRKKELWWQKGQSLLLSLLSILTLPTLAMHP